MHGVCRRLRRSSAPRVTPPTVVADAAGCRWAFPPDVDLTIHSVPLDEVFFDTFDGGAVPADRIPRPELRARLLDAIPPIDEPVYEDITGACHWLDPADLVLGYVAGGQAYAYPFKILNFHEIVNDEIDGVPVLVSYCPLCRSGVVYDRRVAGETLSFGNTSALYESDLVMVDRATGSYWWQGGGPGHRRAPHRHDVGAASFRGRHLGGLAAPASRNAHPES